MTDHLAAAKELLSLVNNVVDDLDQVAGLERGASAHALVDIAESLRTFNSDRSQWYREVLDVLSAAKGEPPRCTAVSGWLPHHRCTRRLGHTEFVRTALHVDETGIAFSNPVGHVDEGSPVGSGQPEAAPDSQDGDEPRVCGVCGKEDVRVICTSEDGPLTRTQWCAHHEALYYQSQENGANKTNADDWATSRMNEWFGPCPEDS